MLVYKRVMQLRSICQHIELEKFSETTSKLVEKGVMFGVQEMHG